MMTASSDLRTAVLLAATPEPPEQAEAAREARAGALRSDAPGRIVETAERLYRQFGHQKTTVADIARALSMSPANIYRFFRSKDAVNDAVCRRLLDDLVSSATRVAQRSVTAEGRLRVLLLELARLSLERSRKNEQLHQLLAAARSENWPVAAEHAARIQRILGAIIADGMRRGEFRNVDAQRAGGCVHAAMTRYLHPTLILDRGSLEQPTPDAMVDFCLAALR
jgi:AcrR family transcriptional regulator